MSHHTFLMKKSVVSQGPQMLSGEMDWDQCCPAGLGQALREDHREWESPKERCSGREFKSELSGIVITGCWSLPQDSNETVPVRRFFLHRKDSGGKYKDYGIHVEEGPPAALPANANSAGSIPEHGGVHTV